MSFLSNGARRLRDAFRRKPSSSKLEKFTVQIETEKPWLQLQFQDQTDTAVKRPDQLESEMREPPEYVNEDGALEKIQGSMIGMALGDALGAHVEFRPREYLLANPVTDLQGGGTWSLRKGQFTDDTSMALCLANSLVTRGYFCPYDQLVRYKWWFRHGYMSSTGQCFDIGAATKESLLEFEHRQKYFAKRKSIPLEHIDYLTSARAHEKIDVYCSQPGVAGNGALMRLAPVPLFFFRYPADAVEFSGISGEITHGDQKAYDACRYYGALIVGALRGLPKHELLDKQFYTKHIKWFGEGKLCPEILAIAQGSYQQPGGYDDNIRGKGYIVNALEAALWAFYYDKGSFEKGVLDAVNLGDDTDTTAAIYGQLAGAVYGIRALPERWVTQIYAKRFILNLSSWIAYEGKEWSPSKQTSSTSPQSLSLHKPHFSSPGRNDSAVSYQPRGPDARPPAYLDLRKTVSDPTRDESTGAQAKLPSRRFVDQQEIGSHPHAQPTRGPERGYARDDLSYDNGGNEASAWYHSQRPRDQTKDYSRNPRGGPQPYSHLPARTRVPIHLSPRPPAREANSTFSTVL